MKRHLSVLMLFTRSTLYRSLLIILAMAALDGLLLFLAFRNADEFMGFVGLDEIIAAAHLGAVFAICFLLLCALLCLTGCEFGSKQGYTLSRLRVSHRAVIFWQIINNVGHFFIFWAAQTGTILAFCGFYNAQYQQPQATMLVFYQNNFLHSLLPLAEWNRFIRNVILLIALAVTAACFPVRMRAGKKPIAMLLIIYFCIQLFSPDIGLGADVMLIVFSVIITFAAARGICMEADDEAVY